MSDFSDSTPEIRWYIAHTYAGYENKVKANLEKIIENRSLQNVITDVKIPVRIITEQPEEDTASAADETEVTEDTDAAAEDKKKKDPKIIEEKIFPSYVFVKMIMNDETWHVVRNIRGVTGFVGPGSQPTPLSEEEVRNLGIITKETSVSLDVGDSVKIKSGPLEGFEGTVSSVDPDQNKVVVDLVMMGQMAPTSFELSAVEKI